MTSDAGRLTSLWNGKPLDPASDDSFDEPLGLGEAIAEYDRLSADGHKVDPVEFAARYPGLESHLAEFFRNFDYLKGHGDFSPPSAAKPPGPLAGLRSFGGYELLEEIGRGGMGVVYKARQARLGRTVALKTILSGCLASAEDIRRFRQEAEAAARIDHPNVVPVIEVGEYEGQHFFSMGFVDGPSLSEFVADGPLPPRQAAEVVRQIAEAVAAAHARDIIHRDLKPANVLLARVDVIDPADNGRPHARHDGGSGVRLTGPSGHEELTGRYVPKVTDFGLAKFERLDQTRTKVTTPGQIVGTAAYMSSEQANGKEVGKSTDIYALGAVLYCLLTGRPPFQAATIHETLAQVASQEPVSPRRLNPSVHRDLETICLKCLEKEPEKRYASAGDFAKDVGRFLRREPVRARQASRAERAWRWCRRHPREATLAGAAVAALLIGTIASSVFAIREGWAANAERVARSDADDRRREAQEAASDAVKSRTEAELSARAERLARDEAVRQRDVARLRQYQADIRLTADAVRQEEFGRAERLLEAQIPVDGESDHRGWEWYYLLGRCRNRLTKLRGHEGPVTAVAFSTDGKCLASVSLDRTLRLWDLVSYEVTAVLEVDATASSVAWRPGEQQVATGRADGTVRVWDVHTGGLIEQWHAHEGQVRCVCWSPNGDTIATGGDDARTRIWGTDGATLLHELSADARVDSISWSPDGTSVATGERSRCVLWSAESGNRQAEITVGGEPISVAYRPGGTQVAIGLGWRDHGVAVWDLEGKREAIGLGSHQAPVRGVAWRPDGSAFVSVGEDQTARMWRTDGGSTGVILHGHSRAVLGAAWSPEGRLLATASEDATIGIWQVDKVVNEDTPENMVATGHVGPVWQGRWDTTGRRIATTASDRKGRITDVSTGDARTYRSWPVKGAALAWSPDGRWIAAYDEEQESGGHLLRVYDARNLEEVFTIPDQVKWADGLEWSPDGRLLASSGWNGELVISDVAARKAIKRLTPLPAHTRILEVAWSPDGQRLLIGGEGGTVQIWDTVRWTYLRLHDSGHCDGVAWSPDGSRVAAVLGDVQIWDARTGRQLHTLAGHRAAVTAVRWSPDGRRIATGSFDLTIRIWDAETASELLALRGHTHHVTFVEWSPSGEQLLSTGHGHEGTVRIWDATSGYDDATRNTLPWSIAGPFSVDAADGGLPPGIDPAQTVTLPGGRDESWRPVHTGFDCTLDLDQLFSLNNPGAAYAINYIFSPQDQPAQIVLRSAAHMRTWLNSFLIYESEADGTPESTTAAVRLTNGWNRLEFFTSWQRSPGQVYVRLRGAPSPTPLRGVRLALRPEDLPLKRSANDDPFSMSADNAVKQAGLARRVFAASRHSSRSRLLAAFDEAISSAHRRDGAGLVTSVALDHEKEAFASNAALPFSPAMREAAIRYLQEMQVSELPLAKAFDRAILLLDRSGRRPEADDLAADKSAILAPKLLGAWDCRGATFAEEWSYMLFSDGTAQHSDPAKNSPESTWWLDKEALTIVFRGGGVLPEGVVDKCEVEPGGREFIARNNFGESYTARVSSAQASLQKRW